MAAPGPETTTAGPRIRVLQSLRVVRPTTNPYIVMLRDGLRAQPDLDALDFSFRRAIAGRYDVFHVHWPEILLEGRTTTRKLVRQLLLVAFLGRLSLARTAVVRTRHNLERPSGLHWHEHRLLDWLDLLTRVTVVLNPATPAIRASESVLIEHGHYRDWFAGHPRSPAVRGGLAYAGLIRRYKGLENLIAAFVQTAGLPSAATWTLRVGGKPSTPELATLVRDLSAQDPRIHLRLAYLEDAELVELVTSAELVVLPYRFMHNSGSVLAALSLDRPVLVPDNEVNRRLAEEVGPGWVHTFTGDLEPADLLAAVQAVGEGRSEGPHLERRSWQSTGRQHASAYRRAATVGRTRSTVRRRPHHQLGRRLVARVRDDDTGIRVPGEGEGQS